MDETSDIAGPEPMQNPDDPHKILGLTLDASLQEVRAAYENSVLKCYGEYSRGDLEAVRERLRLLHEAYVAALMSSASRRRSSRDPLGPPDLALIELARLEARAVQGDGDKGRALDEPAILQPVNVESSGSPSTADRTPESRTVKPRGLGVQENTLAEPDPAKRRAAFTAVYVLWVLSLGLLVASIWAWWRTLGMASQFFREGSIELARVTDVSPIDKLLRLDISTMSALILFLLALSMLLGTSNLIAKRLWHSSWKDFASHRYSDRLIPEKFGAVAVRLGLIGTLLSFALVAMVISPKQTKDDPSLRRADSEAAAQASAASQPTSSPASGVLSRLGISDQYPASRTSSGVFLLLCASLYSTLVGCCVGYMVAPVISGIGALAAGQVESPEDEILIAQGEYAKRLRDSTFELSLLTEQAATVRLMTEDLAGCRGVFQESMEHLGLVRREMELAIEGLKETRQIRESIETASAGLQNTCAAIGMASEQYKKQVEQSEATNMRLQETAETAVRESTNAMGELKTLADAVRKDAIEPSGRLVGSVLAMVGSLKESVSAIFSVLRRQQSLTEESAEHIAACANPIGVATSQMAKAAEELLRLARKGRGGRRARRAKEAPASEVPSATLLKALAEFQDCVEVLRAQQAEVLTEAANIERNGESANRTVIRTAESLQRLSERDVRSGTPRRKGFWRRLFGWVR